MITIKHLFPTDRPDFIGPDWLRCTDGLSFAKRPPDRIRHDGTLHSLNLWERVACVLLQLQAGDFRNAGALVDVFLNAPDDHLRDCAIDIFAMAAPDDLTDKLALAFDHPNLETRLEAYSRASITCNLDLAPALASRRAATQGNERERVMDALSDMVEPPDKETEIIESKLDDVAFSKRVGELVDELKGAWGSKVALYRGELLSASRLVDDVAELCGGEEEQLDLYGGVVDQILGLLEGMTGIPRLGCLDEDCTPILPKISHMLNKIRQSGLLAKLAPGNRYFFGHRVPATL